MDYIDNKCDFEDQKAKKLKLLGDKESKSKLESIIVVYFSTFAMSLLDLKTTTLG